MFLTNNQSLQVVLTTNPVSSIDVNVDFAQHTARIATAGNSSISVTSITPVTIVEGSNIQIKNITIFNPNSDQIEITIRQNYPTQIIRKVATLRQNQTLQYTDHAGWSLSKA